MDSTNSSKSTNPVPTLTSDASHAPSSSTAPATMPLQKLTTSELEMCHSIVNATPPLQSIVPPSEVQGSSSSTQSRPQNAADVLKRNPAKPVKLNHLMNPVQILTPPLMSRNSNAPSVPSKQTSTIPSSFQNQLQPQMSPTTIKFLSPHLPQKPNSRKWRP